MRKALITGITGQDGSYLAKLLLGKGYKVYGAYKRTSDGERTRLNALGITEQVELIGLEMLEYSNIERLLRKTMPDEIYNLAAQSFVGASFEIPLFTSEVNALGTARLLEAMRVVCPEARFYQASTSEMFGKVQRIPCNEETPFHPRSPYAVSKLYAHWSTVNYREAYRLFTCAGILFNHESPLRGLEFVTRKVTRGVAEIKKGAREKLVLGNLEARRDWGYAPEYVEAMWMMLQHAAPGDYVVATGRSHSVRQFVESAFQAAGFRLAWEGTGVNERAHDAATGRLLVEVSPEQYRPAEVDTLEGDYSKAKRTLGWEPRTTFDELVRLMVEADLRQSLKTTA